MTKLLKKLTPKQDVSSDKPTKTLMTIKKASPEVQNKPIEESKVETNGNTKVQPGSTSKVIEHEPVRKLQVIEPDRVVYSFGRKLSDNNWGNAEVGFTYASSMKDGESLDALINRVVNLVEQKAMEKVTEVVEAMNAQE